MNMHQPIQADPSPYAAYLREAYKARRAKEAAAARKVASSNQNAPTVKREPEPEAPEWKAGTRFDYHERLWLEWKIRQVSNVRNHIAARCAERGITVDDIKAKSQKRELVDFKDRIIYEIKTEVDPGISWGQLARHFGRDHTSLITAYDRGAAAAGDPVALERVKNRRKEASRRFQASKEKGK